MDFPGQLEELFDSARAAFDAQIKQARTAVDSLNAEKAVASKTLVELTEQCTKTKAELETTLANLDKASSLRGLTSALAKARTELERLQDEIVKESKALEVLVKKRTDQETRVVALENDARQATAERARAQETIQNIRNKLEQWPA